MWRVSKSLSPVVCTSHCDFTREAAERRVAEGVRLLQGSLHGSNVLQDPECPSPSNVSARIHSPRASKGPLWWGWKRWC